MAAEAASGKGEKGSTKGSKEKLYGGVLNDEYEDDMSGKQRYHSRREKYYGDQIRDPVKMPSQSPQKTKSKVPEVTSSSSLSRAIGYIISPVKYIASAFSRSSSESNQVEQPKPKPKRRSLSPNRSKGESPPTLQDTFKKSEDVSPVFGTLPKIPDAALKYTDTSPLTRAVPVPKSLSGTATSASTAAVKDKPSPSSKKKDPKKSQSQQMKSSSKTFKTYSPRNYTSDTNNISQITLSKSGNGLNIRQSNHLSYRVTSVEIDSRKPETDSQRLLKYDTPVLTSWSNNARCQLSPAFVVEKDELSFPEVYFSKLPTHSIQNCSNPVSDHLDFMETSSQKYLRSRFDHMIEPPDESPKKYGKRMSEITIVLDNKLRLKEAAFSNHEPTESDSPSGASVSKSPDAAEDSVIEPEQAQTPETDKHDAVTSRHKHGPKTTAVRSLSNTASDNGKHTVDTVIIIRNMPSPKSPPKSPRSSTNATKKSGRPDSPSGNKKKSQKDKKSKKIASSMTSPVSKSPVPKKSNKSGYRIITIKRTSSVSHHAVVATKPVAVAPPSSEVAGPIETATNQEDNGLSSDSSQLANIPFALSVEPTTAAADTDRNVTVAEVASTDAATTQAPVILETTDASPLSSATKAHPPVKVSKFYVSRAAGSNNYLNKEKPLSSNDHDLETWLSQALMSLPSKKDQKSSSEARSVQDKTKSESSSPVAMKVTVLKVKEPKSTVAKKPVASKSSEDGKSVSQREDSGTPKSLKPYLQLKAEDENNSMNPVLQMNSGSESGNPLLQMKDETNADALKATILLLKQEERGTETILSLSPQWNGKEEVVNTAAPNATKTPPSDAAKTPPSDAAPVSTKDIHGSDSATSSKKLISGLDVDEYPQYMSASATLHGEFP